MQKQVVLILCLLGLAGLLVAQTTYTVNFDLSVDNYPDEATYNLLTPTGNYYWSEDQTFTDDYENHNFNLELGGGNYTFVCYDSYGDGGIAGDITDVVADTLLASWDSNYGLEGSYDFFLGDPANLISRAINPNPLTPGLDVDPTDVTLTWDWGSNNVMYKVYIGNAPDSLTEVVALTEITSPTGSFHIGPLAYYHYTYYWRVDVADATTRSILPGTVWQFTTKSLDSPLDYDYLEAFNEAALADTDWVMDGTMSWFLTSMEDGYSLYSPFWSSPEGNYANLYPPQIDLSCVKYLAFDWSHYYNSSYPLDELDVDITLDSGVTWTNLWSRTGSAFESNDGAGNTTPGTFVNVLLDLRAYSGLARIRFHAYSGYGPNMYIDNIHLIVPQPPVGEDVYISEVSDNLPGEDDGTGFIELHNSTDLPIGLSGCTIVQGVESGGIFYPNVTETGAPVGCTYPIPAGTIIDAHKYITIGNGADEATFINAWGITGNIHYLPGDSGLDITNGWAYQLNTPVLRAEIDHSPDVPLNEEIVQTTYDVWTPGAPADATPGQNSGGQSLPVELSSFTAAVTAGKTVMLEWMTQSETGLIGYHVLRGDTDTSTDAVRLTDTVIEATNSSSQTIYDYEDTQVSLQHTYYYWLEAIDADGATHRFGPVTAIVQPDTPEEHEFYATTALCGNAPNPFNPNTVISYSLRGTEGEPVEAELAVYNIRGQRVRTLVSGLTQPGDHSIMWNGRDDSGRAVSSGVYFYRLTAPNFNQINKMMLLK